jgi:hypothetical protein
MASSGVIIGKTKRVSPSIVFAKNPTAKKRGSAVNFKPTISEIVDIYKGIPEAVLRVVIDGF